MYGQNDPGSHSISSTKMDPVKFMHAELEAVRVVTRRIELHQAMEAKMFGKVMELQSSLRSVKQTVDKATKSMGGGLNTNLAETMELKFNQMKKEYMYSVQDASQKGARRRRQRADGR